MGKVVALHRADPVFTPGALNGPQTQILSADQGMRFEYSWICSPPKIKFNLKKFTLSI